MRRVTLACLDQEKKVFQATRCLDKATFNGQQQDLKDKNMDNLD